MKYINCLIVIPLLAWLNLTACTPAPTAIPPATATPTEISAEEESTEPTSQPTPATPKPQATEKSEVRAQALTNLNLRGGPSTNYPMVGNLLEGSEITVIGRNENSSWLYVKKDDGDEVWLTGDPALVQVDQTLVAKLPVVEAPPPPYDASQPMVSKALNEIPLVVHHKSNFTCASHGGLNYLLPEVRDGNVIGPLAGDFVYSGNNVLFRLSNGSLQLIRENPIARFEGGEEFLPFYKAMQLFESGEISWTGDFGRTGRGVPGCDPKAP